MPKRLLLDEEERGESPIPICLDIVEIVVARDLDEVRIDETGARHLLEQRGTGG